MTSSLEWGKWWQQSQLQTVRRHTHFPLWAFMWLYIKHSWVLVRPGVFTQRWVLTLGTGSLSRDGASGAARLIWASGRTSVRQTLCWTSGALDISPRALCCVLRLSGSSGGGQATTRGRTCHRTPTFVESSSFLVTWHQSIIIESRVCEWR